MKNEVKDFWENCDQVFAHLATEKWIKNEEHLVSSWRTIFLNNFNFVNSTVVDYGIGGGYLGRALFREKGISKYIGIDIAERSLKTAAANLKHIDSSKIELLLAPQNFSKFNANYFISIAVIQHFPDLEYLNSFLVNLNNSNIENIILQIRYDEETIFTDAYSSIDDVAQSCKTNNTYLLKQLTNYSNTHVGPILKHNYQYVFYKIKK